jgi:hypothetical protein
VIVERRVELALMASRWGTGDAVVDGHLGRVHGSLPLLRNTFRSCAEKSSHERDEAKIFSQQDIPRKLDEVRQNLGGPENINENPETAPSKRILQIAEDYQNALHGPMAIGAIGMDAIRKACPHAEAWLRRIEAL